ncbi:MAG: T9SS type A sorting domain-containing protein [Bacteroidota bacterium]|nr:MAG: T9SS type A sorting domain-containing protein [Bacteroidota bacterium]
MGVHAFCDYCDTIFVAPTGSNPKNIQSNLVQVYPNPAQEMITIVLDSEQPTTVRILDVSGRVQTQLEADKAAQGISIPVRQLANGLYFIQAESQGERWHGSFLKK